MKPHPKAEAERWLVQARGDLGFAEVGAREGYHKSADELNRLLGQAPRIPGGLHGELIRHVQQKTGARFKRMPRQIRDEVLSSFFNALRALAAQEDSRDERS